MEQQSVRKTYKYRLDPTSEQQTAMDVTVCDSTKSAWRLATLGMITIWSFPTREGIR